MASILLNKRTLFRNFKTCFSTKFSKTLEYKKCYRILGISEDSDQETIRTAYLELVKKYHPDSGHNEADTGKFHEIDKAFKTLISKISKERWQVEDVDPKEQDIKHTAPQHRQYLSFEGVGSGTPFQRQKQYSKVRAMQAAENVYQHRVAKVTAEENALMEKVPAKRYVHKIKTKYGFDRLVEDLIQESISKGEFNKLSGVGKPLNNQNRNPYVDFVTHKLNEVLIENGFTPEWITLHKEIREETDHLRMSLMYERQAFGPFPLTIEENMDWSEIVYKHCPIINQINNKIAKFNLLVPILEKQMIQICIEKEAQKAIKTGKSFKDMGLSGRPKKISNNYQNSDITDSSPKNIFSFIDSFFKK